jgi:hypothetical protein
MDEKKAKGRPKKIDAEELVTLNLRVTKTDRDKLRDITEEQGNISDTDTIRRFIRSTWKPKK